MVEPTPLDRALDQVPPDEFVALATSFQNISVDAVDARLVASARVMKEIGVLILEAVGRRPQRDLSDDDITFGRLSTGTNDE